MENLHLLFRLLRGTRAKHLWGVIGIESGISLQLSCLFTYGGRNTTTESGRYPLNEEMVPMPNSPDEPASTSARSTATRPTEAPAGHLVCAYSPRWLSGPTPSFEGLVATWSPADGHDPDGTDAR